jgi:hypothetical protein
LWSVLAGSAAADGGARSVTSHILFGVSPERSFSVLVGGEPAGSSPAVSDSLGVLAFLVDDGALPPGGITVTVTTAAAPAISALAVDGVTPTGAVVRWDTDRPATSQVEYGPAPGYGSLSPLNEDLVTSHAVTLEGLEPGTLYLVRALSIGVEGLPAAPAASSFETLPIGPIGPPTIGGVAARPLSSMFVAVMWTTDRPATSQVRYGMKGALDLATAADTTRVRDHLVLVGPVVPQAAYTFVALSACGSDTAACDPGVFESPGFLSLAPDAKAPRVMRATVSGVQDTCAVLRWATDRPCSTWVEFGRDAGFADLCAGAALGDCGYEATVGGLLPSTVYTYRVCAMDGAGAFTASELDSFRTAPSKRDIEPGAPITTTTVPGNEGGSASVSFSLRPNPATEDAVLAFYLPEPARVRATIFSTAGRLVRVLSDREWSAGAHSLPWDLASDDGRSVASGAYLCAIESAGAVVTRKIVVLR